MASGLPDYLPEFRPKFGKVTVTRNQVSCPALATTSIILVSGRGVIYGGILWLDHTASQRNSMPRLRIDDSSISNTSFVDMNKHGVNVPMIESAFLLKYDDVNFIYAVGIGVGIAFEESFEVLYEEEHGGEPGVTAKVLYRLI